MKEILKRSTKVMLLCLLAFIGTTQLKAQSIGISRAEFQTHYRRQQTLFWCWASSAEMVLSYEGITLHQDAIVTLIKGAPLGTSGSPADMIKSTNRILNDTNGQPFVMSGQYVIGAPVSTVLFNQLKSKRPVILTYNSGQSMGHAVVLTGIDYKIVDLDNTLQITKFYVFDPFAYKPIVNNYGQQLYDNFNKPMFQNDDSLIYKVYDLWLENGSVTLKTASNNYVGTISGVILIDGAKL